MALDKYVHRVVGSQRYVVYMCLKNVDTKTLGTTKINYCSMAQIIKNIQTQPQRDYASLCTHAIPGSELDRVTNISVDTRSKRLEQRRHRLRLQINHLNTSGVVARGKKLSTY